MKNRSGAKRQIGTGVRKGKTKNQQHKKAKGMSKDVSRKRGIQLTFNKTHKVPGNPGARKAFSAKRRVRRGR